MVVQFSCPGCRQPIEVDDQWAEKAVGCPFCRQVVTAPAASTLEADDMAGVNVARPGPAMAAAPPPAGKLAVVGLALACAAVVGVLVSTFLLMRVVSGLAIENLPPEDVMKAMQNELAKPENSATLWAMTVLQLLVMVLWIAGLTVSIVALARSQRKPLAGVVGVCVSLVLPMMLCGSIMII